MPRFPLRGFGVISASLLRWVWPRGRGRRSQCDVVKPSVVGKTAQIDIGIDAGYHSALRKLPDGVSPVPVNGGLVFAVASQVKLIVVEGRGEIVVIERSGAVDDGASAVVFLEELRHAGDAIDELSPRPVAARLHVNHGNEVLRGARGEAREIIDLTLHVRRGGEIVVAPHREAQFARRFHVVAVVWRFVGGSLGGLDEHKANVLVLRHARPIDHALVARDVDAVVGGMLVAWREHAAGGGVATIFSLVWAAPGGKAHHKARHHHCRQRVAQ